MDDIIKFAQRILELDRQLQSACLQNEEFKKFLLLAIAAQPGGKVRLTGLKNGVDLNFADKGISFVLHGGEYLQLSQIDEFGNYRKLSRKDLFELFPLLENNPEESGLKA